MLPRNRRPLTRPASAATSDNRARAKSRLLSVSEKKDLLSDKAAATYYRLDQLLRSLGDDVETVTHQTFIAYKRDMNFVCVDLRPARDTVLLYVRVDPEAIDVEDGFTRDVSKIGHYGTGDVEVTLRSPADVNRAKAIVKEAYARGRFKGSR